VLIGSHVNQADPLAIAAAEDADLVQIFLGDPQSWKKPPPRDDVDELRASALPIYVHAPWRRPTTASASPPARSCRTPVTPPPRSAPAP
jgi:hypothetical protein